MSNGDNDGRKVLGILGGMGTIAAADAFTRVAEMQDAPTDQDYLEVVLHNNSRVPDRTRHLVHGEASPVPEVLRSVKLLEAAGCRVLMLACMTSHHHLADFRAATGSEVLDGVAETVARIRTVHPDARKVGVLATSGSLSCGLYQDPLIAAGLEPVVLAADDQERLFMDAVYAPWGVKAGHTDGRPRERLTRAAKRLAEMGAEVLIGGCTEVQVVLGDEAAGLPLVHALDCLCRAAILRCGGRLREGGSA